MTSELQEAYNEWLITFGFKWVKGYEVGNHTEWDAFRLLYSKHLHYKYDDEFDEAQYKLKQPHEIRDPK